ncbi:MAG: metal ABC transporter permease [bacterium]|nr:metal ABC transporter permease [bacterium]
MTIDLYSLGLALLAATAAGLVGGVALMKRMSLAGDVISHIALPGLGLALLWNWNPLIGGAITLFLGTLIIWRLERNTNVSTETAIGVIFTASVAIGALLTPSEDLIEALFGGFGIITQGQFLIGVGLSLAVIAILLAIKDKLMLSLFSPDLAVSSGVNVDRVHLIYLLLFSGTVLLGLRFLGALLVGALIIIPAAIARQLTHNLKLFFVLSSLAAIFATAIGFVVHVRFGFPLGPSIVSVAAGMFAISTLKKID